MNQKEFKIGDRVRLSENSSNYEYYNKNQSKGNDGILEKINGAGFYVLWDHGYKDVYQDFDLEFALTEEEKIEENKKLEKLAKDCPYKIGDHIILKSVIGGISETELGNVYVIHSGDYKRFNIRNVISGNSYSCTIDCFESIDKYDWAKKLIEDVELKKQWLEERSRKDIEFQNKFNEYSKLSKQLNFEFIKVKWKQYIDIIESACNDIYGDNWSLTLPTTGNYSAYLYLKFPEFKISNTNTGGEHTIRNLYLRLTFDVRTWRMTESVKGNRETLTLSEYQSSYNHSHVRTGFSSSFQDCCLGSTSLAELDSDLRRDWNKDKLALYLYQLTTYVLWESEEGGPYMRFKQITSRSSSIPLVATGRLEQIYNDFVKKSVNFNFKFDVTNNRFNLITDDNFELELLKYCSAEKCIKLANGTYVNGNVNVDSVLREANSACRTIISDFRGKPIKQQIIADPVQSEDREFRPYPQVKDYVIGKLTKEMNNFMLTKKVYE